MLMVSCSAWTYIGSKDCVAHALDLPTALFQAQNLRNRAEKLGLHGYNSRTRAESYEAAAKMMQERASNYVSRLKPSCL